MQHPSSGSLRTGACLILASWASASSLSAEALELAPAAQLELPTTSNTVYQIERSSTLGAWEPWQGWILGDGNKHVFHAPLAGEGTFFRVSPHTVVDLNAQLATLRTSTGLPAIAAAVIKDGRLHAIGSVGQRRFNTLAPVSIGDHWHHGSITKSMTATLAGVLVEKGRVSWETTLGEVFPTKVAAMASGWSSVTLRQLLANSGGAPEDLNSTGIWTKLWNFQGLPDAGRALLFDEVTSRALRYTPGSGYEYSNAGFAIAGHLLERKLGQPWETLMRTYVFEPLGMDSAGFGVPATPRHLDHPVGHSGTVASPTIWDPATGADNPPAIGPAGTVHSSIVDIARYVQLHLLGARGQEGLLLTPATFSTIHAPAFGNSYALGWNVTTRTWANGTVLQHSGSNTQWFTVIWIAPNINWAVVVCTNFGGSLAANKTDEVVGYLLNNYGP